MDDDMSVRPMIPGRRWLTPGVWLIVAAGAVGCGQSKNARPGGPLDGGSEGHAANPMAEAGTTDTTPDASRDATPEMGRPDADPLVTAGWQWRPCGILPPSAVDATAIAYSPTNEEIAAAYKDGRVVLHSVDPNTADRVLHTGGLRTSAIAFSPDGTVLAEAHETVWLRRLRDGEVMARTSATDTGGAFVQLRFSPDGTRLLGWAADAISVWDATTGALVARLAETSLGASWAQDRLLVARKNTNNRLAIELVTLPGLGRTAVVLAGTPDAGTPDLASVVLSPTGNTIAANTDSFTESRSAIWSVPDGAMVFSGGPARASTFVYSPDGRHVFLDDRVVNTASGGVERTIPYLGAYPAMLNNGGTRLAVFTSIRDLAAAAVYDLASGGELRVFANLSDVGVSGRRLFDMAVSGDGKLLATSDDRNLMMFRLGAAFEKSAALQSRDRCALQFQIAFSADGASFVCSGDGWSVSDTLSGQILETVPPPPDVFSNGCLWSLAGLSPRATWLSLGTRGQSLNVRRADRRGEAFSAVATARCNARASFNLDETLMATTGPELYRTSDWTLVWPTAVVPTTGQSESPFGDVQFVPGERQLLVSSCGGLNRPDTDIFSCAYSLHSAATGERLQGLPTLNAHQASFSPEGHWIAAGGILHHLPSGTERTVELGPQTARLSVFVPTNGDVIAAMPDNTLVRYCRDPAMP